MLMCRGWYLNHHVNSQGYLEVTVNLCWVGRMYVTTQVALII